MKTIIEIGKQKVILNLQKGYDISCPIRKGKNNIHAWYVPDVRIDPVMENGWVGSTRLGGSVNFRNITFNPHGHGTHTETAEHILNEKISINTTLHDYFVPALLATLEPEKKKDDLIITKKCLKNLDFSDLHRALIIRTLPNDRAKKTKNYSNTNPPYFTVEAITFILERGIDHLLVDLPSIDKEKDGGQLLGHHTFWNTKGKINKHKTITELIYVPDLIKDGNYLLNLQIAPFENDASPSRPIIFPYHPTA